MVDEVVDEVAISSVVMVWSMSQSNVMMVIVSMVMVVVLRVSVSLVVEVVDHRLLLLLLI